MSKYYYLIGTVQKVYGLKGALIIKLGDKEPVFLGQPEKFFLHIKGTYVPYLIRKWSLQNRHVLVELVHITTRSEAIKLRGYSVFIHQKDKEKVATQADPHEKLVGRLVEDVHQGTLGYVKSIYKRQMQPCLCIDYRDSGLLIPLHDHFIQKVALQKITVRLPENYIATLLNL